MTGTTAIRQSSLTTNQVEIFYQVAMSQPQSHLFEVTLKVNNWYKDELDLKMPVWTPGSYLVREYAKQVQDFIAEDSNSKKSLFSQKVAKNHWQINTENCSNITVSYRVFANELTVRTNHLDATHGYFNGAALFFFIPGLEEQAVQVKIVPPQPDWQVITTLDSPSEQENTFIAKDFDTLVDTPIEIGIHQLYEFEVLGKPHQLAIWGKGNANAQQIIADTQKIIEVEADLYGGLPYEKYLFLLHLSGSGYGGLEHKDSCSLNYPRFAFRNKDRYNRFMQLVAHEFFHLWNVKRIRPKALEKFDYERENYTTSLWFSEGTTSYYDVLIPLRAKIYNQKTCLENLSKDITKYLNIPGRKIQPLGESSFDAWIKLYRRDAHSDNNQISYYLKGELVSLLLDLLIRAKHNSQRSLDDVMHRMWLDFGKNEVGFAPEQLQAVIESVAAEDLSEFFHKYIYTTAELPFDEYLEPFGLKLKATTEDKPAPHLGIKVQSENNQEVVKFVEANSPSAIAGIDPGDQLLAIEGFRVTSESLSDRLKDYQVGDTIQVTVFHQDELKTLPVQLAKPQPSGYEIVLIENASSVQQQNLSAWLS
ncbi:MAG: M61 family metallopeptidase [Xenococcaceae cyanobacterium MO_188.B29]|nr:M61 family metallopeptidase [Xenococcaceae cyanobacterium MO_188.B29]